MRIDPRGVSRPQVDAGTAAASGVEVRSADATAAPAAPDMNRSPELQRLLDLVAQHPEVRQELLRAVAERLANGDYATREAAQRSAEAILRGEEPLGNPLSSASNDRDTAR